jgi:hypothetical protein
MTFVRLTALVTSTFVSLSAFAYVEPVHEVITRRAFDRAAVDFQARLGISRTTAIAGSSPTKLMTDGSVDEDANARALAHFYDPINEVALTLGKSPVCGPAPFSTRTDLWATDPSTTNSRNVPAARKHYAASLTGPNPGTRAVHQKELFYSLGHLVHLVQDMAQPEHTRNDVHLILSGSAAFLNDYIAALVGERMPSLYEAWALENVAGQNPLVSLDVHPNVTLADYASYFHTLDGRGLADYTNRNFVTQDTNYGDYGYIDQLPCFQYSTPFQSAAMLRIEPEVAYALRHDDGSCCYIQTVQDEAVYTWRTSDGEFDDFHSHHSSLDLETKKYDPNASFYSLSDGSYQRRAAMLIPRAVGYSAGFIEHFFRGKIDAKWKRTTSGANFSHELTITNLSSEKIGADAKISAVYRADPAYFGQSGSNDTGTIFANGELSNLAPGFDGLAPGASVTFVVPQVFGLKDEDAVTGFERRIAITGTLGAEQDAVIGLVQPAVKGPLKIVFRYVTSSGNLAAFYLKDTDGKLTVVFPNTNHNFIPNCKITVIPNGYVVEIDPPDNRPFYVEGFVNGMLPCDEFGTATIEWYRDGMLVKTIEGQIDECEANYLGDSIPF